MAKYVYPIILHPELDGGHSVDISDLKIGTQGETAARNPNLNQPNIAASFTKPFQGEDTGCMNENGAFSPDYHSRTR